MRRAYETLKLCVVGHLNESGVGAMIAEAAHALGHGDHASRVVVESRPVVQAAVAPEVGAHLVSVWRQPERVSYSVLPWGG